MKFFKLAKASEITHNEMIFLSDVSGDNRIFSVAGLPRFALGEILSVRREDNDEIRMEIKADSGFYEISARPWHKFSIYAPDTIAAKNMSVGDRVLLRGNNALPEPAEDADAKISCVSEVLEISKNRKSELEVVFGLSRPLVTKLHFGRLRLPLSGRPKTEIRMRLSPNSVMEISHGGYA